MTEFKKDTGIDNVSEITKLADNEMLANLRAGMRDSFTGLLKTPEVVDGQVLRNVQSLSEATREQYRRYLDALGMGPRSLGELLNVYKEPVQDLKSENILERSAAVMAGKGLPEADRGGFEVKMFDYSLSELREKAPDIFRENAVAQKFMTITGMYNFRLRVMLDKEQFDQSEGNVMKAVQDAQVQVRFSTGYDSCLDVVGSLPYLTLKSLKEQNLKGVWVSLDPPGQLISQYIPNYQEMEQVDPFLTSLTNYSMSWETVSHLMGLDSENQGLVEAGHSRGAARLLYDGKDKWQSSQVGHVLIAPVFEHPGKEGELAGVLLGLGSDIASRTNKITVLRGLTEAAGRRIIEYYTDNEDKELINLYTYVFMQMIAADYEKIILNEYITNLLVTEAPEMRNELGYIKMQEGRDFVFNFLNDRFVNLPSMLEEQRKKLGFMNMGIVKNLPGGHHGWNADGPDTTGVLHTNRNEVVSAITSSAKAVYQGVAEK